MREKKKLLSEEELGRMRRKLQILKIIEIVIWSICLSVHIFIIVMLTLGKHGG